MRLRCSDAWMLGWLEWLKAGHQKRKMCLLAVFGVLLAVLIFSDAQAVKKEYDFEIKKGLEIIGAEERPRVIFFLPELKIPLQENPIGIRYILKKEKLIRKDIDFFKEEQK